MEIIKVEAKGLKNFELECQAETKIDGFVKKSATINLPEPSTWPKLSYHFKQICPSAAFLFSINSSDLEVIEEDSSTVSLTDKPPKTIAKCLFPFTFSVSATKHLASEIFTRSKQVQIAYLTTQVKGSDIMKVVGTVWFKVVGPKSIPKLKSKATWMDLNAVIDHLAEPDTSVTSSLPEILEVENKLSTPDAFLRDSTTVSVVFHSVNTYLKNPSLTPVANIGTEVIPREKSLFDSQNGSNSLYTHPILKPVALKSEDSKSFIELYLANNDLVIFSASHNLQKLMPFKQYHWEYDWRWMAGTGGLSPLHQSSGPGEPTMTVSVMLQPSAAQYSKFEGLEFLICGVELDSTIKNEDVVFSVEFADLASKSKSAVSTENSKIAPFMTSKDRTTGVSTSDKDTPHNTTIAIVKYGEGAETSSVYIFYPLHPFFRAKMKGIRLSMKLQASSKGRLWWQSPKIALASIEIPSTMSSVLSSAENMNGVKWEIKGADISQSDSEKVTSKIFGVIRWKSTKMKFLNSDISTQLDSLRNFNDLVPVKGIQPGLLTSILSTNLRSELEKESKPESISDYKVAVKKMGEDILFLRRQNKILRRDNKQLEEHYIQLENSVIFSSADQADLSVLTKADLIHKILEQSQRLLSEIASRQSLQSKVKKIQNALIEKNEVEAKLMQVQQAHSAQQKLVRNLQLKYEKYRKCSDICKQQEEVIVQLDSLLEQSVQNEKVKEAIAVLSKENARLRKTFNRDHDPSSPQRDPAHEATINALRADASKLRAKCSELEAQLEESRRKKSHGLHEQTKVFEANQKVKIASAREKTLIRELEVNAKTWAQDKVHYEVQLAECRAIVETLKEQLATYRTRATAPQQPGLSSRVPKTVAAEQQNRHQPRSRAEVITDPTRLSHQSRSRAKNPTTLPPTRNSQDSRNPWQSQPEEARRRSLMSISRQLHPYSRNSSIRPHPQSVFENSLDPRLSF